MRAINPPREVYDRTLDILDENSRPDDVVRYVFAAGVDAGRAQIIKAVLAAYDRFIDTDDLDTFARAMGKLRAVSYRIAFVSINGGRHEVSHQYASIVEAQRAAERVAKGITSYYSARVINRLDEEVSIGHRAGPGGTGERWTWRTP